MDGAASFCFVVDWLLTNTIEAKMSTETVTEQSYDTSEQPSLDSLIRVW